MRGVANLPVKNIVKHINSNRGPLRSMSIWVPKKRENDNVVEESAVNVKVDQQPIAAFSRPPPVPPVLGPLMALYLLELGSGSDGSDD